jgi:Peptidase family C25, C terminal ig-like domain./Peptidase family C25./Propeptide_C25.
MKNKILLFLCAMLFSFMAYSQEWVGITSNEPDAIQTKLISADDVSTTVNVQVPGFFTMDVSTPRGEAKIVSTPKSVSTSAAGEPNLPMIAIPAIIGDNAKMEVRIVSSQYTDYPMEIAPSKGDFPRTINPEDVPYFYGSAYSKDEFFPAEQVDLYAPYILRNYRGQNIVVYPFAYNPVSKTLRVYHDITVEMYQNGFSGENQMVRKTNVIKVDPEFYSLYQNEFINFISLPSKYTPIEEEGDMLIICSDAFMDAMLPFVNWKRQIGRQTTMVGTSTTGTTDVSIQNYILSQYNSNNNLTYVLLVGDVAQIPGHQYSSGAYSGKSDNWYGQIVGNDSYNDIFVGRFSAENTDHVTTQVNKVITYERDLNAADTWLSNGDGVAAYAGGGGHFNEDDWQHMNNIRTDLLNYNYATVHQDYQNVSGYTSSAAILSGHINEGVSIVNYCNHGSETSWGVFSYNNSHVNALTNVNRLPIVWSVACLNGKYDYYQPCFGETWLRANNGTNEMPTGAIGGMFSYISQPWVPPMYGQDEMVDILVESYNDNIKRTLGGTSFNGNMKILDQYGQGAGQGHGTYMSWILFGDPSLTLRNATPTDMGVTHGSSITTSSTSFVVNATNGNDARATLTQNNEILGSAVIANGTANITLTAPGTTGTATLTVFGYNKITYIATITVTSGGGGSPITVTANATPSIIAQGASSTLTATATGGSGSYTYNWNPATGLNNANIQSPIATPTYTTNYTVNVSDGTENGSASVEVTVVVPPTNVAATVINTNDIRVSWTAANPATSYRIYRNGTFLQNTTTTSYIDSNLNPAQYCYSVSAVYSDVESPQSAEVCATVVAPLTATASANPSVIADGGTSNLTVMANGGTGNYTYSWTPATGLNNAHIQSPVASPTATTTYTVSVSDGNGSVTASATVSVVKSPILISVEGEEHPILTWDAPALADSYKIYRDNVLVCNNVTGTSYTDTQILLCPQDEYCYEVSAVYNNVESVRSNEECISVPLECTAPQAFEGSYLWNEEEDYGVQLNWTAPAEYPCWTLTAFNIYRSTTNSNYELLATVTVVDGQTDYEYFDAVEMGEYYYQLTASYEKNNQICESEAAVNNGNDFLLITVTNLNEDGESGILVYPNPTDAFVIIEAEDLIKVSVVNVFGHVLVEKTSGNKAFKIDMSGFESGIYMIRVETSAGTDTKRVIVR